jgi:hypothetical protein
MTLPTGVQPSTVVMGDVDADGDLDLFCTNEIFGTVSIFLNDGSGTFSPPYFNPTPNSPTRDLALGDLDGDGDLDFVATNWGVRNSKVSIRFNEPLPPPQITVIPPSVHTATASQSFIAAGGTTPYMFSIAGGTLPLGLSLAATGVLSGTPTQTGSFSLTVQVTDHNGFSAVAGSPPMR